MQLARVLALQAFESEGAEIVDLEIAAGRTKENHVLGRVVYAFGQTLGGLENGVF